MGMLTGFERVLRDSGRPYELFDGWRSRDARTVRGLGYKDVRAVMVHTSEGGDWRYKDGVEFPKLDDTMDRAGTHTYPILIGRTGVIGMVAAGTGAHAGRGVYPRGARPVYPDLSIPRDQGNWYTIGVALDANEHGHPPTTAQLESLIALLCAIDREWGRRLPILMHAEYGELNGAPTRTDPTGVDWADIRRARDLGSWQALQDEKAAAAGARSMQGTPAAWTVRPGDSLWRIQEATGVRVATLQRLNGISGSLIYPGQRLRLA